MRSSLVMSLIGMTSMALALLVGCGDDDNKPVTSQVGQSCARTADCDPGLSCIGNVCYKGTPPASGGAGGGANLVPPPLGTEGQSCTSRLDCKTGLNCFNNRCTAPASGDAGATGSGGLQLGARGESCRVNSDCDKDLVCIATAVVGTGICDLAHFGVEGTGLTCSGECLEASDCCQLPMALHTTNIRSCEDIADAISTGSIDCDAPADAAAGKLCFQQWAYCDCKGKDTWSCDEDTHACHYDGDCDPAAGLDAPAAVPANRASMTSRREPAIRTPRAASEPRRRPAPMTNLVWASKSSTARLTTCARRESALATAETSSAIGSARAISIAAQGRSATPRRSACRTRLASLIPSVRSPTATLPSSATTELARSLARRIAIARLPV